MASVAIRIHDKFQARAARERIGPSGRPLRELAPLLGDSGRARFGSGAAVALKRALSVVLWLLFWSGCFLAGALIFVHLSALG